MKEIRVKPFLEARMVAVLIGLLIALGATIERAVEATAEYQHARHFKLTHRHP